MNNEQVSSNSIKLYLIIFICSLSLLITLFIYLVLSHKLEATNLKVESLIVPVVNTSKNNIESMPLNKDTYLLHSDEFISKFLTEYIVTRYTVSGNNTNEFSLNKLTNINNTSILQEASILRVTGNPPTPVWSPAYLDFLNKKDGELNEITELLKNNTTRTVEIISPPKKVNDWWIAEVEFIYKSPTTYTLSTARKEKYEIGFDILTRNPPSLRDMNQSSLQNPSSIFHIIVNHIKKTRL